MSDAYLRFIPQDPRLIPDREAQEAALKLFRHLAPKAWDISCWISAEKMKYVDAGGNAEWIRCPLCSKEIDEEWWGEAMNRAYDGEGFTDLSITTPCCHSLSTLNDLEYYFPSGFAQFCLEAFNPGLNEAQVQELQPQLEAALGCMLTKIWTHY